MTGNSGDGSYWKLIAGVYGAKNGTIIQSYKENNEEIKLDNIVLQEIFTFVHDGLYDEKATLSSRASVNYSWENKLALDRIAYRLRFHSTNLNSQGGSSIYYGHSLRCVAKSLN